jgi:hypothetical protein
MSDRFKIGNSDGNGSTPGAYYRESAPAKIDVNSEESLAKWEAVLHLSRSDLMNAIKEFGPMVRDIRRGLRSQNDEAA